MRKLSRDSRGRFVYTPDPEIERQIAEENRLANKIIIALKSLKLTPEDVGMKEFSETGHWTIGSYVRPFLLGVSLGICTAGDFNESATTTLLTELKDALGLKAKLEIKATA